MKTEEIMKEKFIDFLKREGALEKYERNIASEVNYDDRFDSIETLIDNRAVDVDTYYFVVAAFCFDETKEGEDYWENLNDKWQQELNKEK